jgi:site-specific DNA-methyltransferase (cytosine-N4-specific)
MESSTLAGCKDTVGHQREGFCGVCHRCGARRIDQSLGLEKTPQEYVANMVDVFREVWRIMRDDGTVFLNLGDSYASGNGTCFNPGGGSSSLGKGRKEAGAHPLDRGNKSTLDLSGLKPKDLVGIPWRVALALQAEGWYLRQDIIWHKPNPMPESVTDRCTKSHEYIFLLTKSAMYYYDNEAIKEEGKWSTEDRDEKRNGLRQRKPSGWDTRQGAHGAFHREGRAKDIEYTLSHTSRRNKRSVWTIPTQPYPEAHFATFPETLVEPCILAGSRAGDMVLDPFAGSGTTLWVAQRLGRRAVGYELKAEYCDLAIKRVPQLAMSIDTQGRPVETPV